MASSRNVWKLIKDNDSNYKEFTWRMWLQVVSLTLDRTGVFHVLFSHTASPVAENHTAYQLVERYVILRAEYWHTTPDKATSA